jgi:hypothetical protein
MVYVSPVDCGLCGLFLGAGVPGASTYCTRCAEYITAEAYEHDDSNALGALIALGVGIVLATLFFGGRK